MKAYALLEYQASSKGNPKRHKKSKHEDKIYFCNLYDSQQRTQLTLILLNSQDTKARNISVTHVSIRQLEAYPLLLINSENMKIRNMLVTHVTIR